MLIPHTPEGWFNEVHGPTSSMNQPAPKPQAAVSAGYRAIVVHGRAQACLVLRQGAPVALISAVGAASLGGPGWWRALVDDVCAACPKTPCIDILDCADAPGLAMAALRLGQRHLILWPDCPAFEAVRSAAASIGAIVYNVRPPALDMADRQAMRQLAEYLRPKIPGAPPDRDSASPTR